MSDSGFQNAHGVNYTPATNYAEASGSLDVITFNIKGFPEALNGISNNEARELSTIIESWNADIVGIPKPLGNAGFSKSRNGYIQGIKFF